MRHVVVFPADQELQYHPILLRLCSHRLCVSEVVTHDGNGIQAKPVERLQCLYAKGGAH